MLCISFIWQLLGLIWLVSLGPLSKTHRPLVNGLYGRPLGIVQYMHLVQDLQGSPYLGRVSSNRGTENIVTFGDTHILSGNCEGIVYTSSAGYLAPETGYSICSSVCP